MPLKGIPQAISPELLYALASMGHGDEIVLADSNFPADSIARANGARLISCDGLPIPKLLRQILKLLPLDQYVAQPVALMDMVDNDKKKGLDVPIWNEYKQIVGDNVQFEMVERFQFYERAKNCFAVVRKCRTPQTGPLRLERVTKGPDPTTVASVLVLGTGEGAIYANIILKKGVIPKKAAKSEHEDDAE